MFLATRRGGTKGGWSSTNDRHILGITNGFNIASPPGNFAPYISIYGNQRCREPHDSSRVHIADYRTDARLRENQCYRCSPHDNSLDHSDCLPKRMLMRLSSTILPCLSYCTTLRAWAKITRSVRSTHRTFETYPTLLSRKIYSCIAPQAFNRSKYLHRDTILAAAAAYQGAAC
jgi:hypothetical protein